MDHLGTADAEDDSGSLTRLAPSPHSEAVAHEFKELSLQPSQYLPPLNERKNGEYLYYYQTKRDNYQERGFFLQKQCRIEVAHCIPESLIHHIV
uniref:Uncharacterized protein n=1 Tax=Strigops habroptila TaxID=2489341 RepID=A0A672TST8_STRHB